MQIAKTMKEGILFEDLELFIDQQGQASGI